MVEDRTPLVPAELWPRVHDLVLAALDAPDCERESILSTAEDSAIAAWARQLLVTSDDGSFSRVWGDPDLLHGMGALRVGAVIADRYQLIGHLGSGTFGDVYEAIDRAGDQVVAIKFLRYRPSDAALERECATLRVLDIPGVVPFIDAFEHEGDFLLVMDRLEGVPFPGTVPEASEDAAALWVAIEPAALSLLEAVERLHSAGFVHGDLKPSNVIVNAKGRASILDLGLARRWRDEKDGSGQLGIGAPLYQAPEVAAGRLPTPAADLFSVGVMLHRALTGDAAAESGVAERLPTTDDRFETHVAPPPRGPSGFLPPIERCVQGLPERAVRLIDGLLRPIESRFPTATAAIERIGVGSIEERLFPRGAAAPGQSASAGSCPTVAAALADLEEGRSVEWTGPAESGRRRALDELAAELADRGREVVAIEAGERGAWVEALIAPAERSLFSSDSAAADLVRQRVSALFSRGGVLLVADADVDAVVSPISADDLERWRDAGACVFVRRAKANRPRFEPRGAEELEHLFEGPEVIFHLPSDAAAALHRRTGGAAGAVVRELCSWSLAGLAEPTAPGRFRVTRATLEQLELIPGAVRPTRGGALAGIGREERRILAFIQLAGCAVPIEYLAHCDRELSFEWESRSAVLLERGLVARVEEEGMERWVGHARVVPTEYLTPHETERAHRWIDGTLEEDEPARLRHLIMAERTEEIPAAAMAIGRALIVEGRPLRAFATLREGLRAVSARGGDPTRSEELCAEMTEAALLSQSSAAVEGVLHELAFTELPTRFRTSTYQLCSFASAQMRGARDQWEVLGSELLEAPNDRWAVWRSRLLALFGGRAGKRDWVEAAVARLRGLADQGDREAIGTLGTVLGEIAYVEGRPDEAVLFHRRAAEAANDAGRRTARLLAVASSAIEAAQFDEAARCTLEAERCSIEGRFSLQEARAHVLRTHIAVRRGDPIEVHAEVVEAIVRCGSDSLSASIHQSLAVLALRGQRNSAALTHAERCVEFVAKSGFEPGVLIARALCVAAGGGCSRTEWLELLQQAERCAVAGLSIQAIALLLVPAELPAPIPTRLRATLDLLVSKIPEGYRSAPREVWSVEDSVTRILERMER